MLYRCAPFALIAITICSAIWIDRHYKHYEPPRSSARPAYIWEQIGVTEQEWEEIQIRSREIEDERGYSEQGECL